MPARVVEFGDGFQRPRNRHPFLRPLHVVGPRLVQRAVTIKDHQLEVRFGFHGSNRQSGDIGHAVHGRLQLRQQAQPVGPQGGVIGIDHHPVEERIHRGTQLRQDSH